MPLKLEPLKKECETIEFGKVKLKIPGVLPMELMIEFYDLKNMDPKKTTKKDLKGILELTKEILYIENDNTKVDNFVKTLDIFNLIRVVTFITEYTSTSEDGKKKDLKAASES